MRSNVMMIRAAVPVHSHAKESRLRIVATSPSSQMQPSALLDPDAES